MTPMKNPSRMKEFQRIDVDAILLMVRRDEERKKQRKVFSIHRTIWSIYNGLPLWLVSRWHLVRI